MAREPNGRPSDRLQARAVAAVANDREGKSEPRARVNGEIDLLVRDEARDDEVILTWRLGSHGNRTRIHRGWDQVGFAPVILLDPGHYRAGDPDVAIDAAGRNGVPHPQVVDSDWQQPSNRPPQVFADEIVAVVPCPAHWRQAVADVQRC